MIVLEMKIALTVVKKCKNRYQLEPMFVIIVGMWKIETLMQQLTFLKKD